MNKMNNSKYGAAVGTAVLLLIVALAFTSCPPPFESELVKAARQTVEEEQPRVPLAPSFLAANVVGANGVDLTWSDNSDNETEFHIQRRVNGNPDWQTVETVGADSTTFSDAGLPTNTEYVYRVRAANDAGVSEWSAEVHVTLLETDAPTVSVSTPIDPAGTFPIDITITFSEEVTNFSEGDIQVTNADVSSGSLQTTNNIEYTAQLVNPTDPSTITVTIPEAAAEDLVGNESELCEFQFDYNSSVLTVSLNSSEDPGPTDINPLALTISFNEPVTGFTLSDLQCSNCTADNLNTSDDQVFTVDISPTIDEGTVQILIPEGSAQSTITGRDNQEGSFQIDYVVYVTGVTLNTASTTITVGETEQLTATVSPADATNTEVNWSSSNTNVATVNASGLVSAEAVGTAIITVTTDDGNYTDGCNVTAEIWSVSQSGSSVSPGSAINYSNTHDNFDFSVKACPGGTFPKGTNDNSEATVSSFWIGETEATNEIVACVYQWAYNEGKMAGGTVNSSTVTLYGQEVLNLDEGEIQISFSGDTFSVDPGFEKYPCIEITWYGAILFCNWLTEMVNGDDDELVYTGFDSDWIDDETVENTSKTGFRLPSADEHECCARYIGFYLPFAINHGGTYWTPGNYASGATAAYTNSSETGEVTWFRDNADIEPNSHFYSSSGTWLGTHPIGTAGNGSGNGEILTGNSNQLGIYDKSGNVGEWSFTENESSYRVVSGGGWLGDGFDQQVGRFSHDRPDESWYLTGFRIARSP